LHSEHLLPQATPGVGDLVLVQVAKLLDIERAAVGLAANRPGLLSIADRNLYAAKHGGRTVWPRRRDSTHHSPEVPLGFTALMGIDPIRVG
jgi:hypothetical protein